MQYFIGIVPPDEYRERIVAFQKRWEGNGLCDVVEPHITVKAQSGLATDMAWLPIIRTICASFPRFRVSISVPASFDGVVTYLSVDSDRIRELHQRLVDAVSPAPELIAEYRELAGYVPHLTLGQTHWGMTEAELSEMKVSALGGLAPFPTFEVEYVRVYRKIDKHAYAPYEDIKLMDESGFSGLPAAQMEF